MDHIGTFNPTMDLGSIKDKYTSSECKHSSGRSGIRECVESSNQKNYISCEKQFSDNEIKSIPLQDRLVAVSKKTIKFLCQATLTLTLPVAPSALAGFAFGATGSAAVGVDGAGFAACAELAAGPALIALAGFAIGAFWGSVQGERATSDVGTGVAKGVATGVATSVCMGSVGAASLVTSSAIGSTVEAVGNYFFKKDD
ncbi:hypothetical protein [Endozoicomonas sp. GU-1]|uniref:hypothetical protein n=1 Tax=Endozoicomonas sp. GU-1 TaxID=3009078 RepID=UPI0022B45726|nr:hypothetical protein [Endozoicomonas sp. GU-1]WBA80992.1 hypothetical protein O2T12_22250 [Endozoicomonas sp. GU-1]WBA88560.1 hypothetical protein O3276_11445 [Endozoicomonas sp. GU-1]